MANRLRELTADQVRQACDETSFDFQSTAELPDSIHIIGQHRAVEAIEFGMDIDGRGFNIYVLGPPGTGRTATIRRFVADRARNKPAPDDWCYVHNFAQPDKPRCFRLPAGRGRQFRSDMERLVEEIRGDIQQALEREEYQQARNQIVQQLQKDQSQRFAELEKKARERGFTLQRGPRGVAVAPLKDGEPLSAEEFANLPEEERQRLETEGQSLQEDVQKAVREVRSRSREVKEKLQELERQTVLYAVEDNIDALKDAYSDFPDVADYLEQVKDDVVSNASTFFASQGEEGEEGQHPLAVALGQVRNPLARYRVNLIVDNADSEGAPVITETQPTYQNLIGKVERQARLGMLTTDFSMIKPGALHRANGGYLILEAEHLLRHPFSYSALKQAIKNREVKITDLGELLSVISTAGLEPQPIPLEAKVIVIGNPLLYYLLHQLDEEFSELFKVKADFNVQMDRTPENAHLYARFLGAQRVHEDWLPMDRSGVARVVEYGSELVGDQTKLSTRFSDVCDIAREANYWARKADAEVVRRDHVQQAIDAKTRRANRVEERIQEMIQRGDIFIDTGGTTVGQANGLSIVSLGDYAFGRPARITARTYMGRGKVVDIEREVELGGPVHSKGVLILGGYLRGTYGQRRPITLAASLSFEQHYQEVDGDSASSAELYALLSSLAGLPLRQDIAITGSVNQRGQVQPIGGVSQKVQGYFDVCQARGLTGSQGVLIPQANVKNLMLREETVEAIRQGTFHVWPVETIEQGIELLTGTPAGEMQPDGTYPEGTVNHAVDRRLADFAQQWKEIAGPRQPPQQ
ncbi:MAG: Lon protease family protein [Candidatus Brocadiia bacterium]